MFNHIISLTMIQPPEKKTPGGIATQQANGSLGGSEEKSQKKRQVDHRRPWTFP